MSSYAVKDLVRAAKGLISRIVPKQAGNFELAIISQENGKDVFEIESRDGKVILSGSNAVSIASALNWYLKYYCHCQLSWNGDNMRLPQTLPLVREKVRKNTVYDQRVYLNYCTFNYSSSWWDWERWEREIDWMAMNGINMPLAITGQEAVWQNTLKRFGMDDDEIRNFLVGPAYQAWQWMSNIENWAGPLPQSWIDRSIKLGQQILKRERELGMTPILQGFTGYVPIALKEHFPGADITIKPSWLKYFPPGTAQLDPLDPLFAELGKTFIEEQTKLFGTNHFYAGDPFHEGEPPKRYRGYLAKVGRALYDVTCSADPEAIIVMQSWSIREEVARAVPVDKLLVLDLNSTKWRKNQAFWGSKWVMGIIHNYGGNTAMAGALQRVLKQQSAGALRDKVYRNLTGIGIFPEAIEHNPVIYEAAAEMAWHSTTPDMKKWIMSYIHARYGLADPATQLAWKVLLRTFYTGKTSVESRRESTLTARPALKVYGSSMNGGLNNYKNYDFQDAWNAPKAMLQSSASLHDLATWRYDLVDMFRQCLADLGLPLHQSLSDAYIAGNKALFVDSFTVFLDLMDDLDELLATDVHFLLGKWLSDARKLGTTPAEKDLYEQNARWQVTVWGPYEADAVLFDYCNRQWSGLLKYFYKKRWEDYFNFLLLELDKPAEERYVETDAINHRFHRPANEANEFYRALSKWEYTWCAAGDSEKYITEPSGDCFETVTRLYAKWWPVAYEMYQQIALISTV